MIERANPGIEARKLAIGSLLRIPVVGDGGGQPAQAPSAVSPAPEFKASYMIQKGDTLWSIARSRGTTVELLAAANGRALDGVLKPGETLKVPE